MVEQPDTNTEIEIPLIAQDPGPAPNRPRNRAIECRQECCTLVHLGCWGILLLFIYVGLPVMAGVCSIHKTEVCLVTGDQITYKDTHYKSSALIGLNETTCYISDNKLSGNHLRVTLHEVVFGVCGPLSILSITIWALTLGIMLLHFIAFLIPWLSTNRTCQIMTRGIYRTCGGPSYDTV